MLVRTIWSTRFKLFRRTGRPARRTADMCVRAQLSWPRKPTTAGDSICCPHAIPKLTEIYFASVWRQVEGMEEVGRYGSSWTCVRWVTELICETELDAKFDWIVKTDLVNINVRFLCNEIKSNVYTIPVFLNVYFKYYFRQSEFYNVLWPSRHFSFIYQHSHHRENLLNLLVFSALKLGSQWNPKTL